MVCKRIFGEDGEDELVIGLIAQPWKIKGNILKISPEEFINFSSSDYVKVGWNFYIEQNSEGHICINKETRIYCTSNNAKRKFSIYWFVISFFSGVIRNEMLKSIRNELIKTRVG